MIYLYSCLTVLAFLIGQRISQKLKSSVLNPFVIALTLVITVIVIGKVPYTDYYQGNFPINNLLGVSVVALALPFYEQLPQIRKKWRQITLVVIFGTCFTMLTGVFFAVLLGASPDILAAIVPKSVSTPIAIAIATQIGGSSAITAVGVLVAGLLGSVFGFAVLHRIGVRNVRAIGLSMGAVSHALGTGRCMEYSIKTGSYSSIALVLCGVLSSVLAPFVFKLVMHLFY
ncbi:CidB/LrgB family autolysis modulator [Actinobacillus pleuropneumoniae]|uniref:CidB/LrgB family autolysis modulator n=2 Tax=Actinobacillus pleuropneumoniae TaxID=715 RepID=A0A9Q4DHM5_ACTPL|nr:CidB/LrgB family autolysis modulator [Actinobacillus pleuropneumoniae]ABY69345.1 putative effector of murein hydrolase [Actinobacillus pleuropneumoniae serovar 3 str. JL03]MCL7720529.1 CidB/LrgB family autolysis modulator [Actinobacillus pleuropneumoniae]MCL7727924.1 CidB/LrgB family autolysis modulator [Actinobacillus pleuropneumoniae]MCL7729724.1 CidB/LrgB family autolysis modulator [Actinobacillus pleuropneumoniae]MCY6367707.1 CidB/LrgB family autolysis modulator [Actinobacillus pleuropn